MTANLGRSKWGAGDSLPPDRETAEAEGGLSADFVDELLELDAKQAVESLASCDSLGNGADDPTAFPGPIAEAAYWDDGAVVGIQGPVGSGKTTTMLKSRLRRAMAAPCSVIDGRRRYKLLVIRATYRQLWSTTIPDFLKVFPKHLGDWSGGRGGPVTFTMLHDDGLRIDPPAGHSGDWSNEIEFIVEFMAFGDDIQGSLRGYQATDIWMHEMDTNPQDVLINAITRIGRYPDQKHYLGYPAAMRDYGQLVGDFNAPEPGNWTIDLFHDAEKREQLLALMNAELPEGTAAIRISFYRQPGFNEPGCENLSNLPPSYYHKQIATLTLQGRGDQIDRLVYNKIVYAKAGEPVFQREFSRRIHVSEVTLRPWPGIPLRLGLDQGFKGAAVIGQEMTEGIGRNRRCFWQILAELHFPKERLMAKVFGERLAELLETRFPGIPIEGGWGDMAGEAGASQAADENDTWNRLVSRAAGFRIRPQRIGTNRITPRLNAVRAALEAPTSGGRTGLLIDPSCTFLIAGFEARYVWIFEVNQTGDKRKVPDKSLTEANVMDALQYMLLSDVRADGTTDAPTSPAERGLMGHNGGPSLAGDTGGLTSGYDILNPYGDI